MRKRDIMLKQFEEDFKKKVVGLTKKEVEAKLGKPAKKTKSGWEYFEELSMGMHSFMKVATVVFKKDKGVDVKAREEGIGCEIIE